MQPLKNASEKNMLSLGVILANKVVPESMSDQKCLAAQGFDLNFLKLVAGLLLPEANHDCCFSGVVSACLC